MLRRPTATPPDDDPGIDPPRPVRDVPDLSSLSIAGLDRRRVAAILGAALAIWIVIAFARQVGEAQAAGVRAEQMALDNAALATQIDAYQRELEVIQRQRFIDQQARAYGVGSKKEIAFTLDPGAPPLADDAPGSSSVRLGADRTRVTPLDRWLTLLFGPSE